MSEQDSFHGKYFRVTDLGIETRRRQLILTAPEVFDPYIKNCQSPFRISSPEMYKEWHRALEVARRRFKYLRESFRRPRNLSPSRRFAILKRDDFTCQYCGRWAPWVALEVDHIHPVRAGGNVSDDNLTTACSECNRGKSDS